MSDFFLNMPLPRDEKQLDRLEKSLRRREAELLRAQEIDMRSNPLKYFIPHPRQEKFFESAAATRRAVFAGNRWGKTTVGTVEDISHAIGYRPFYTESHPLRTAGIEQSRGVKILIICADWDKVRELFTDDTLSVENKGKIWQYMPDGVVSGVRRNRQNGVIDTIYIETIYKGRKRQSLIAFDTVKSFKGNPQSAESSDWDIIHVDEPLPRPLWEAHSRGLMDRRGRAWFLLTPLEEIWIYNYFVDRAENESYFHMHGEIYDNVTLSREAIEEYMETLTEEERECREKGIPRALGKLVYWNYVDEDTQLIEKPKGWETPFKPPADTCIRVAIDPHPQTPHAVLFVATDAFGNSFLYHEIYKNCTIEDLCKEILSHTEGKRVVLTICDPIAWNENQADTRDIIWADLFWQHGVYVERAVKTKVEGIARTKEQLAKRPPCMYVLKHMRRTVFEFKNYVYDKENKPVDKDDHMMENLYRLVCAGLTYVKQEDTEGGAVEYLPIEAQF
jgi:hypothetical protein